MWYGLDGQPIDIYAAEDLLKNEAARRIAHTAVTTDQGRITVSTIFLVLDHRFTGDGPPVLWETMIFGGPDDCFTRRYCFADDARAGHQEVLAWLRGILDAEGTRVITEETFDTQESLATLLPSTESEQAP